MKPNTLRNKRNPRWSRCVHTRTRHDLKCTSESKPSFWDSTGIETHGHRSGSGFDPSVHLGWCRFRGYQCRPTPGFQVFRSVLRVIGTKLLKLWTNSLYRRSYSLDPTCTQNPFCTNLNSNIRNRNPAL